MARRRPFTVMQTQTAVTLPVADNADFALNGIIVPEDGAQLLEVGLLITTAGGAGTATFTIQAELLGSTTVLSSTSGPLDVDAPLESVLVAVGPAAGGSGVAAPTKGKRIALNFNYDAGTVGTAPVATVWARWLT